MTLTFDQALERALSNNEGLKVAKERVVETQARVQESKTNFLPQVNLGYNYTPSQRFPVIKIPAGVFGPEEQTFQAGFAQTEQPAAVRQPADLHRRPPEQCLRHHHRRRSTRRSSSSNARGRKSNTAWSRRSTRR